MTLFRPELLNRPLQSLAVFTHCRMQWEHWTTLTRPCLVTTSLWWKTVAEERLPSTSSLVQTISGGPSRVTNLFGRSWSDCWRKKQRCSRTRPWWMLIRAMFGSPSQARTSRSQWKSSWKRPRASSVCTSRPSGRRQTMVRKFTAGFRLWLDCCISSFFFSISL